MSTEDQQNAKFTIKSIHGPSEAQGQQGLNREVKYTNVSGVAKCKKKKNTITPAIDCLRFFNLENAVVDLMRSSRGPYSVFSRILLPQKI